MLALLLLPVTLLLSLAAASPLPRSSSNFGITAPANGTSIAPGAAFAFNYRTRADYSVSSYNFTVWLSSTPALPAPGADDTGYFFGRFAEANYPAVPYTPNPPPAQLVMPNFSVSPGGFGSGAAGSDVPMYLVVVEEWMNGEPTVGRRLSLSYSEIVYNATTTA